MSEPRWEATGYGLRATGDKPPRRTTWGFPFSLWEKLASYSAPDEGSPGSATHPPPVRRAAHAPLRGAAHPPVRDAAHAPVRRAAQAPLRGAAHPPVFPFSLREKVAPYSAPDEGSPQIWTALLLTVADSPVPRGRGPGLSASVGQERPHPRACVRVHSAGSGANAPFPPETQTREPAWNARTSWRLPLCLLLSACSLAPAPPPSLTPAERLDLLASGLSTAVARYTDDLGAVADVLEAADPQLVPLLLPHDTAGTLTDDASEIPVGPDIAWVKIRREVRGGVVEYRGRVEGDDLDRVQIYVDAQGGPAPDRVYTLGNPILQSEVIPGGTMADIGVGVPGQAFADDRGWTFVLPMANPGPVSMTVRARRADDTGISDPTERDRVDDAAGGVFGATSEAVGLLVALLSEGGHGGPPLRAGDDGGPEDDPDLLVAVALAWAPWLDLVDAAVRPQVRADARDRLRYAREVDAWLSERARPWSVHGLGSVQKVLWAWPGGQGVVYGARPLAWESDALSAEAYRFHVADLETLRILRDEFPLKDTPYTTGDARDDKTWADLDYRADDAGMEALCDQKLLDRRTCFRWQRDRDEQRSLGLVDGAPIAMNLGTSASIQTDRWVEEDSFAGDCSTATSVMISMLQSVGLAPLALGWAGQTWYEPTHNLPLVWDGLRFLPMQASPSAKWRSKPAFVYALVPPLQSHAMGVGWGGFGAAGPSVPGSQTSYADLDSLLMEGVVAETVMRWLTEGQAGGWPQI